MLTERDATNLSLELGSVVLQSDWGSWLDRFRNTFSATSVGLFVMDYPLQPGSVFSQSGMTERQCALYRQTYQFIDPYVSVYPRMSPLEAHSFDDLAAASNIPLSDAFREYQVSGGWTNAMFARVPIDGSLSVLLTCTLPAQATIADSVDADAFRLVTKQIGQALRIERALYEHQAARDRANGILNELAFPMLLLDQTGSVSLSNRAARELLDEGEPLRTGGRYGLRASSDQFATRFDKILAAVLHGETSRDFMLLESDNPESGSYHALFLRKDEATDRGSLSNESDASVLVVLVPRNDQRSFNPDYLASAFDLSAREAEVGSLLVRGAELADIADVLGISKEGVRHHLKQLFWKTDTHSQRELTKALFALSGPFKSSELPGPSARSRRLN